MKLFKTDILLFSRASPVKPGKRFVSFFIDFIVVFIFTYLIFLGGFEITKRTDSYKYAQGIVSDEIAYYVDYSEETHVVEYLEKESATRKDSDGIIIENLCRAIVHSYNVLGNSDLPEFKIEDYSSVLKYGEATSQTDTISYFYTQYIPQHPERNISNLDGKDPIVYLFDTYKQSFGDNAEIFIFNQEKSEIPLLNIRTAYYISYFLKYDSEDNIGEKGLDYYNAYYNAYNIMLEQAEMLIIKSEPYYTDHYLVYQKYQNKQSAYVNYTILASLVLGYLVGSLLPKLLFKDDRTIGRLVMGLGVITKDNEKTKWYVKLIHSICGIFGFISIITIIYMFPPFYGNYDFMMVPLIGNNYSFSLVILFFVILIIAMINYIPLLFNHTRQSLLDFALRISVVDSRHIDEGDKDDPTEGKPL